MTQDSSQCNHGRAWPSLDSKTGWYCPECRSDCPDPSPKVSANLNAMDVSGNIDKKITMRVYAYPSHGDHYFRFTAFSGRDWKIDRHIPGGSIRSRIAIARAREVERWIAANRDHRAILKMISQWGHRQN